MQKKVNGHIDWHESIKSDILYYSQRMHLGHNYLLNAFTLFRLRNPLLMEQRALLPRLVISLLLLLGNTHELSAGENGGSSEGLSVTTQTAEAGPEVVTFTDTFHTITSG